MEAILVRLSRDRLWTITRNGIISNEISAYKFNRCEECLAYDDWKRICVISKTSLCPLDKFSRYLVISGNSPTVGIKLSLFTYLIITKKEWIIQ